MQPNNSKMHTIVGWVAVIIIGAVVLGVFVFQNRISWGPNPVMQSDYWQTYTDTDYGFSVNYPKKLKTTITKVTNDKGRLTSISFENKRFDIQVVNSVLGGEYDPACNTPAGAESETPENYINGVLFRAVPVSKFYSVETSTSATLYCVMQNGLGYELTLQYIYGNDDPVNVDTTIELSTMLDSFKFVGIPKVLTGGVVRDFKGDIYSDWKTYSYSNSKYKLSYPSTWEALEIPGGVALFVDDPGFERKSSMTFASFAAYDHTPIPENIMGIPKVLSELGGRWIFDFDKECNYVQFAGQQAYKCLRSTGTKTESHIYMLDKANGNVLLEISDYLNNDISQRVLSTFQFTN